MNDTLTDITIVLDQSGSMGRVQMDTIGGFNSFVSTQREAPGEAVLTLREFSHEHKIVYDTVPIKEVPNLTTADYIPWGYTCLLDAIGYAIDEAGARFSAMEESERPGKVLLVIMTDGEENNSRKYDIKTVFEMITRQRDEYQWQIVFIGANQDAIKTGRSLGIDDTNSVTYESTPEGTKNVLQEMGDNTVAYRSFSGKPTKEFFRK